MLTKCTLDKQRSAINYHRDTRVQITSRSSHTPGTGGRSKIYVRKQSRVVAAQFHLVSTRTIIHRRTSCRCLSTSLLLIETSCPLAAAHPASRRRPQRSRKSPTLPQTIRDTHTITLCMTLTASLRRRNLRPRLQATKQAILLRHRRATSLPTCTSIHEVAPPATPTLS